MASSGFPQVRQYRPEEADVDSLWGATRQNRVRLSKCLAHGDPLPHTDAYVAPTHARRVSEFVFHPWDIKVNEDPIQGLLEAFDNLKE